MKALVIGGSGTIGKAIVNRLVSDGFEVIVHYNNTNIETLQSDYIGKPVEFLQCDLNQDIDLQAHFSWITKLDCLVFASGTALYGQLQDVTDKEIDDCYQMHVRQLIRICRFFVDQLRQSSHGRIVVISSIWGETGASMESIYSAMKGAQIAFVKALSQELAMTTVTVNAIAPGFVSGNMARVWSEEELQAITEELPQQRLIDPIEIAHTCSYLCHPMARSITGTIQKVNGGWYV